MAIESGARKLGISGKEMHDRLQKQGLIHRRLINKYEILHTQSLEWVADDISETLLNWEAEGWLHQYDIVEGGVANDNVIDTVEDYENGIITAEQALGQLKYKKVNHQICILNQDIVDKHLSFISSETIKW